MRPRIFSFNLKANKEVLCSMRNYCCALLLVTGTLLGLSDGVMAQQLSDLIPGETIYQDHPWKEASKPKNNNKSYDYVNVKDLDSNNILNYNDLNYYLWSWTEGSNRTLKDASNDINYKKMMDKKPFDPEAALEAALSVPLEEIKSTEQKTRFISEMRKKVQDNVEEQKRINPNCQDPEKALSDRSCYELSAGHEAALRKVLAFRTGQKWEKETDKEGKVIISCAPGLILADNKSCKSPADDQAAAAEKAAEAKKNAQKEAAKKAADAEEARKTKCSNSSNHNLDECKAEKEAAENAAEAKKNAQKEAAKKAADAEEARKTKCSNSSNHNLDECKAEKEAAENAAEAKKNAQKEAAKKAADAEEARKTKCSNSSNHNLDECKAEKEAAENAAEAKKNAQKEAAKKAADAEEARKTKCSNSSNHHLDECKAEKEAAENAAEAKKNAQKEAAKKAADAEEARKTKCSNSSNHNLDECKAEKEAAENAAEAKKNAQKEAAKKAADAEEARKTKCSNSSNHHLDECKAEKEAAENAAEAKKNAQKEAAKKAADAEEARKTKCSNSSNHHLDECKAEKDAAEAKRVQLCKNSQNHNDSQCAKEKEAARVEFCKIEDNLDNPKCTQEKKELQAFCTKEENATEIKCGKYLADRNPKPQPAIAPPRQIPLHEIVYSVLPTVANKLQLLSAGRSLVWEDIWDCEEKTRSAWAKVFGLYENHLFSDQVGAPRTESKMMGFQVGQYLHRSEKNDLALTFSSAQASGDIYTMGMVAIEGQQPDKSKKIGTYSMTAFSSGMVWRSYFRNGAYLQTMAQFSYYTGNAGTEKKEGLESRTLNALGYGGLISSALVYPIEVKSNFFFQPEMELILQHNHFLPRQDSKNLSVDFGSLSQVTWRVGARFLWDNARGKFCESAEAERKFRISPVVLVNYWQNFTGNSTLRYELDDHKLLHSDQRVEAGLGLMLSKGEKFKMQAWGLYNKSLRDKTTWGWSGNVGLFWNW